MACNPERSEARIRNRRPIPNKGSRLLHSNDEVGRGDRPLERAAPVARDCRLARVRRRCSRARGRRRHRVAPERRGRRVGARLRAARPAPGVAARARVRLPAQRHAARGRSGVPAAVADVAARMAAGLGSTIVDAGVRATGTPSLVVGDVRRSVSIDELRASVLAAGAAHPGVTIEETGDITASEARDRIVSRDLHRAELLSIPVTLLVLLFAFGAIVAALVPVAARADRRCRRLRPARADQPGLPARRQRRRSSSC